ncbi:hypothetical protein [Streptomyces phaeochromogenes]
MAAADPRIAPSPEIASAGTGTAEAAGKGHEAAALPALKSFLAYTVCEAGQEDLTDIHYAPLPVSMAARVRDVIQTLS